MKYASRYLLFCCSALFLCLTLGCASPPDEGTKTSGLLGSWKVESQALVLGHDSVFILHIGEDEQLSVAEPHKTTSVVEANVTAQNIDFTWERRPARSENTLWKWTVRFEGQFDNSADKISGEFDGVFYSPYCSPLKQQDEFSDECEPTATSGRWVANRIIPASE